MRGLLLGISCLFSVLSCIAQEISQDSIKYDTIVIEKAPFVISKTVYVSYKNENSGRFYIQVGGGSFFNSKTYSSFLNDSLFFKLNIHPRAFYLINTGIYGDFFKYQLGVRYNKTEVFSEEIRIHSTINKYSVKIIDTLDRYYSVFQGDTSWHYQTEVRTLEKSDTSYTFTNNQSKQRFTLVQFPVTISIPVQFNRFLFNPSLGVITSFINLQSDTEYFDKAYQKFFFSPVISINVGYQLCKFAEISLESFYSFNIKNPVLLPSGMPGLSLQLQYIF